MFSTILVASDGSEASDRIVECVRPLRIIGVRRAVLVHVFHVRDVGGLYETLRSEMQPRLERQAGVLREAGLETTIEMPLGFPADELQRIARERGAELIVAGSRGASLARERVLGSTAADLLHRLEFPLLLIRIELAGEEGARCRAVCEGLFRNILFPTDFSENASHAFLHLEHIVREASSRVTLLHVQDRSRVERHLKHRLEEFNQIDAERLAGMKLRLEQCGAEAVSVEIPYGLPVEEILKLARSGDFSLIVMGAQGRGFFSEIFLGSVANQVARLAPLPVLLVPALR
ncbi:MAG: universal stress protein [Bryobacteraceae bacterium]